MKRLIKQEGCDVYAGGLYKLWNGLSFSTIGPAAAL